MASVTLLALSLFIGYAKSTVIDCNLGATCESTTQNCPAGEACTIFCNGTALTSKICRNAIFNCPHDFVCTFFCDNDGWNGATSSSGDGRICQNVEINGASNGDLYVKATTEYNFTHATNEIFQHGTVNCGSSSICDVTCVGAQACEDVTINGDTNTEINLEAVTLPSPRVGFLHTGAFRTGTVNCGSNAECNINCNGDESCTSAQFVGGDNGDLNLLATGSDTLVTSVLLSPTEIFCPRNADCNVVCQCSDCNSDRGTCQDIIINATNSNKLILNAMGGSVLFNAYIICPTDSAAEECVIIINDGTDNLELVNSVIFSDNGFLGFSLDCMEAIPCWTETAPFEFAPLLICDLEQGLNCTIKQVNTEWNVFRCMEEGEDCDVSLSPTMHPTDNPTNDPTESEDSDSESSDSESSGALFANHEYNNLDLMRHEQENNEDMHININLSKSLLANLWLILFLIIAILIVISCFKYVVQHLNKQH